VHTHDVLLGLLAPIAGFVVLLELAAGTLVVAHVIDIRGHVGRGFVGSTAVICALILALAILIAINIPDGILLHGGALSATHIQALVRWCIGLAAAMAVDAFFCAVGTDAARTVVGAIVAVVAVMTLAQAALAFGAATGGSGLAAAAFVPAAFVSGTALGGMLLGHWYLVAPSLSFRPLRQVTAMMFAALAVESVIVALVLVQASGDVRSRLLAGGDALSFWLLVVGAGIVFTAAITAVTLHFARIRANQPATAMLYALIISVVMGVVPAHLLFFVTGVPV
jgi:hypothetical protein